MRAEHGSRWVGQVCREHGQAEKDFFLRDHWSSNFVLQEHCHFRSWASGGTARATPQRSPLDLQEKLISRTVAIVFFLHSFF